MILAPVEFDGDMTADEALRRLARHGIWRLATHPAVRERMASIQARLGLAEGAAQGLVATLQREPSGFGAAIRWRCGDLVSWHARAMNDVLDGCLAAPSDVPLHRIMGLISDRDASPIDVSDGGESVLRTAVLMADGWPVGVSLVPPSPFDTLATAHVFEGERTYRGEPSPSGGSGDELAVTAWPLVEAPDSCRAGVAFDVVVGLSDRPMAEAARPMQLSAEAGALWIDVTVELMAGQGVTAVDGWSRPMRVMLDDPLAARVSFRLIGLAPASAADSCLTMLEVRYVLRGTVCGSAARPLLVLPSEPLGAPGPALAAVPGAMPLPAACAPMALGADATPPDLTIEIAKPDRNPAQGRYVCRMYSRHAMKAPMGPFEMDLGEDARTFARQMAEELRLHADDTLLDLVMESNGRLVASRWPPELMLALQEVAAKVAPEPPSVLIVSAEPYVPWELTWLEPPLDATRPSYLGAQVLLGRWLRADMPGTGTPGMPLQITPRPALHPSAKLVVRHLAVMAAWYQAESGLRRLPMAEDEAGSLARDFGALALEATSESLKQVLMASLPMDEGRSVPADAVHFAGHGDFDPTRPDGSALFLSDGKPLSAKLFRAAKYGGDQQPLLFLNACMLGIGGDLLGAAGGFPGHSLHGGFGAVLAALWEVDDQVAHDLALAFWRRAMPARNAPGEPIAAILRDLRGRYVPDGPHAPGRSTYLSYVYYGHPQLRLHPPAQSRSAP